jgi:hypothetical protein
VSTAEGQRRLRKPRSPLMWVLIVLGAIVGAALAVGGVILVGLLFWLLIKLIFVAIGHAIGDAFDQIIHGNKSKAS